MSAISTALDVRLARALADGRPGEIAAVYAEAADGAVAGGEAERAAFLRATGLVYALEAGDPLAERLSRLLADERREIVFQRTSAC